jgi:uncharacterized protein YndB with AHSA1/START domain
MLKKSLIILGLILIGFFAYVALQPSDFEIFREVTVKATPEVLFPYINNSEKMNEWMPWKDMDPAMKMTYSGPAEGIGATSTWESAGKMGVGTAVIVESIENKSVKTQLEYTKPMQMSQVAEITLSPNSEGTVVRWSSKGHNKFFCKIVCVFMSMDKMVGGEFEKGLLTLKAKAEAI